MADAERELTVEERCDAEVTRVVQNHLLSARRQLRNQIAEYEQAEKILAGLKPHLAHIEKRLAESGWLDPPEREAEIGASEVREATLRIREERRVAALKQDAARAVDAGNKAQEQGVAADEDPAVA